MENPPLSVLIRPVEGLPGKLGADHWALLHGDTIHEVEGQVMQAGRPQVIRTSPRSNTSPFRIHRYVGNVSVADLERVKSAWLADHPTYDLTDSNCQAFVIDSLRNLGYDTAGLHNQGDILKMFSPTRFKSPSRMPTTPGGTPIEQLDASYDALLKKTGAAVKRAHALEKKVTARRGTDELVLFICPVSTLCQN
jgi:hypothetical protein